MKFPAFAYAEPTTVEEAVSILANDEDARPLAGGQTLLPMMALRLAAPSQLVDLNAIESLREITVAGDTVQVGAMVTHAQNVASDVHPQHLPLLAQAVRHVAHDAVKTRGTIGGSIANADAAAEMSLVAVALEATMQLVGPSGPRAVAAEDFFEGHYTTAIEAGEILIRIDFPITTLRWAFDEVARRPGDFALGMAASGIEFEAGQCTRARIALGAISDRPRRANAAESYLEGRALSDIEIDKAAELATHDLEPNDDIHADAAFRTHLAATMVKRTLTRVMAEVSA